MSKILAVAWREFSSTTMTKGFIIGAFIMPLVLMAMIPLIIVLTESAQGPAVSGQVTVIDPTNELAQRITTALSAETLDAHRQGQMAEAAKKAEEVGLGDLAAGPTQQNQRQLESAFGKVPRITVVRRDEGDLDAAKNQLRDPPDETGYAPLAVVSIEPDAVRKAEGAGTFGGFSLFVRQKLDDRVLDDIRWGVRESIRGARYDAAGVDAASIEALTTVRSGAAVEVTDQGERTATTGLDIMLPLAFMILMMISVMVGGQYLLTTTIEEKSSRVVEVLLSAVSPMQLMAGKIFGQMCVSLVLLTIYAGLGVGSLVVLSMLDKIEPMQLVYLGVFFLLAFTMFAALQTAIGSTVNELREAQSLQVPVMLFIMLPYVFGLPISRDPNSALAMVLSFIPPMNPFVMMIRITSTEPPPTWQILASIGVGAVGSVAFIWFAAKVFRIGLLQFGKAPNLKTLIRWARMA